MVRPQDFTTLISENGWRLKPKKLVFRPSKNSSLGQINFLKVRSFHPDNSGAENFCAVKIRSEWSGPEGLKDLGLRREN
jgi:hypothetical protein